MTVSFAVESCQIGPARRDGTYALLFNCTIDSYTNCCWLSEFSPTTINPVFWHGSFSRELEPHARNGSRGFGQVKHAPGLFQHGPTDIYIYIYIYIYILAG